MITKETPMPVYELYVNEETNVFEVRDESCPKNKDNSNKAIKFVDRLEDDITIEEAHRRYYLTYPQRKVIISDCCKRKK